MNKHNVFKNTIHNNNNNSEQTICHSIIYLYNMAQKYVIRKTEYLL